MRIPELNLITAPATEPVSLAEAKLWIKQDVDTDDDLINILIPQARQYCESYTKRALISQTWEIVSGQPFNPIPLPLGQTISITSVTVIQDDDTSTVQSTDIYHTSTGNDNGKVYLKIGSTWTTTTREFNSFKIRFVAGWANAAAVPAKYKQAILKVVAYMYENRQFTDDDVYLLLQQSGVGKLYK